MLNTQLAEMILEKYGKDALIVYCKIECEKNRVIDEELKKYISEPSDYNYDAEWWSNKYQELINN